MTTTVQYLVSGQPNPMSTGVEFPHYDFIWTDEIARSAGYDSAEQAALDFRDRVGVDWDEPPVVSRRTVTTTDWERV